MAPVPILLASSHPPRVVQAPSASAKWTEGCFWLVVAEVATEMGRRKKYAE